jgi:hypothetical protein
VVSDTPRPRFSPGEGTHWIGCCIGLRAGLDTEARGKILSPLPRIELRSPGRAVSIIIIIVVVVVVIVAGATGIVSKTLKKYL